MKDILLNKRNQKVFVIALFVAILVFASFSYAYFIGSIGGSASTDIDVTTSVNERLVFTEGNPIGIHATLDNFSEGDGSLTGETTTNVKLNAGSQSSTATELYQVYFDITTNDFEYSVDNTTPELVLTITDPEGNTLTEATLPDGTTINTKTVTTLVQDGLGGTASQTVVGFDVTEVTGIIKLYEDYEITNTNPTEATEQNWTAKITFINLDAEQTVNEGKTFNANLLLQQDKITTGNKMISGPAFYDLTSEYRVDILTSTLPTKELHKIIFNDTINETAYNNATDKWDVSVAKNESIVAYVVTENTDNIMYIESNEKIIANEIQGEDILFNKSTFSYFRNLKSLEFNNAYDTSYVTDMQGMFTFLPSLADLDVSSFNTSSVTNMSGAFSIGPALVNLNISMVNTSNVTDMSALFTGNTSLTSLNLSSFDTSNVNDMSAMFSYMTGITDLNLSSFNTSKVRDMEYMFEGSTNLLNLDLSTFDTSQVISMNQMFHSISNLNGMLYAKTQADADKFNDRATTGLKDGVSFTVK